MSWDGEKPIENGTPEKCETCCYCHKHPESDIGWCELGDDWVNINDEYDCWEER